MTSNESSLASVNLRIVIHHTDKDPNAEHTTIWNPEDHLCGHLEISGVTEQHATIDMITIYFEGVSRNWIAAGVEFTKAERKFISQAQDISVQDLISTHTSTIPNRIVLEAPFHFIISKMVGNFHPESPDECLPLPPSIELGHVFTDLTTGHLYAQPSITYYIRASVIYGEPSNGPKLHEAVLPVFLSPHTNELPPTDTSDFPEEFHEQETKLLRSSFRKTALGSLRITLREPPALTYIHGSESSSTGAQLMLEFVSATSRNTSKFPRALSFTIYSLVRVKTFYSVQDFPGPPGQGLLSIRKDTRLRDDVIKLETRTLKDASWGYRFNLEPGLNNELLSSIPLNETSNREPATSHRSLDSNLQAPSGTWISNWSIPIEVEGRLIPTFCSAFVARRYSFIIRVKVNGVQQDPLDLEVPLQVINMSRGSFADDNGLAGEDFLEPRRPSQTDWFNEHVDGDGPPRYYP